ncbi:hypothetical protein GCM10027614_15560 [Micromonospora vulcania]
MNAPLPAVLRRQESPKQPAFLELFFDLVYVFAITQVTHLLVRNISWRSAFEAFVLFLALWWIWVLTAWLTDQFDPQHFLVQFHVILVMLAILLMAIMVPHAFVGHGLFFAVAYLVINFGRVAFIMATARGTPLPGWAKRAAFWFAIAGVMWIAGTFTGGWARGGIWLLALAVDYTSAAFRWPVPWGGTPEWQPLISEYHLAERYRQVVIVAFGEVILTIGMTVADTGAEDHAQSARRTRALVRQHRADVAPLHLPGRRAACSGHRGRREPSSAQQVVVVPAFGHGGGHHPDRGGVHAAH